jgi:hypothetical protein
VALRELAAILRKFVKREDTVARYGGEEFAVVLFNTDKPSGGKVAERLRREVELAEFPNQQVLPGGHLTISVGLASFPEDSAERAGLIAKADAALYCAKRSGRNRVCSELDGSAEAVQLTAHQVSAFWRPEGAGSEAATRVRLHEVSSGGAAVTADGTVRPGERVRLTLTGDFPGRQIELPAEVLWRQSLPGGPDLAGISFGPAGEELRAQMARVFRGRAGSPGQNVGR